MKTKEELNALKEEAETLNKKLAELTEDELQQVSGGSGYVCNIKKSDDPHCTFWLKGMLADCRDCPKRH